MNCDQVRQELAAYSMAALPRPREAAVGSHLEGCPACRKRLQAYRRLDRMVAGDALAGEEALVRAVMAQVRAQPRRRVPAWVGIAEAAWVMVGLALMLWLGVGALSAELGGVASTLGAGVAGVVLGTVAALAGGAAVWFTGRIGEVLEG